MSLECSSQRFIDFIDVIDDFVCAAVSGVFAFDDLNLPSAAICEVLNEFPLCVVGVPVCPDEVWFMVFRFMLWMEDVVRYKLGVIQVLYYFVL